MEFEEIRDRVAKILGFNLVNQKIWDNMPDEELMDKDSRHSIHELAYGDGGDMLATYCVPLDQKKYFSVDIGRKQFQQIEQETGLVFDSIQITNNDGEDTENASVELYFIQKEIRDRGEGDLVEATRSQ